MKIQMICEWSSHKLKILKDTISSKQAVPLNSKANDRNSTNGTKNLPGNFADTSPSTCRRRAGGHRPSG